RPRPRLLHRVAAADSAGSPEKPFVAVGPDRDLLPSARPHRTLKFRRARETHQPPSVAKTGNRRRGSHPMSRNFIVLALAVFTISAQNGPLPLESVAVEGTSVAKETVMEIAGFHVGSPVDKVTIEAGCIKLEESGIFQSINYRYAPGPNRGYA